MKKEKLLLLSTILLGFLWCSCLFYTQFRIKKYDTSFIISDTYDVLYDLGKINYNDNSIELTGWALRPTLDMEFPSIKILIKNKDDPFYIEPKTMMCQNYEITEQIGNGRDYTNSGFYTRILNTYLKKDCNYRVYLWYKPQTDNIFIDTGYDLNTMLMTGE